MSEPGREIRQALRWLLRNRRFTLLAVVTIALGVGPCTAVFSVVNAVVLRSLPFQDPQRLVCLWTRTIENPQPDRLSGPDIQDLRDRCQDFSHIEAYWFRVAGIGEGALAKEVRLAFVTTGLLSALGVQPMLGRGFCETDLDADSGSVAIISYGLWQHRFAGDPGVLGRTCPLLARSATIIGVLPADFPPLPKVNGSEKPQVLTLCRLLSYRHLKFYHAIGRLRPGISFERGQAQLDAVAEQLEQEYPDSNQGRHFYQVAIKKELLGNLDSGLLLLLGAVGLVVLIASANVANLLLTLGIGRRQELATRLVLGASQAGVAGRLLLESLLLGLAGGAAGLLLGWWWLRLLLSLAPANIPRLSEVAIDGRVLLFSLAMTVLAGLLPGLVSVLQLLRTPLRAAVEDRSVSVSPQGGGRLAQLLVLAQMALATVLLIGAGLMVRSCAALLEVDPGFDAEKLLTVLMRIPKEVPKDNAFTQQLQETVQALPAVSSVATVGYLPFRDPTFEGPYTTDVTAAMPVPPESAATGVNVVSRGYFRTMRIPLLEGRGFTLADMVAEHDKVVVVSQAVANQGWPGRSALGGLVYWDGQALRVVGVVGDTGQGSLAAPKMPTIYRPGTRRGVFWLYAVIRTSRDPLDLVEPVRAAILGLDAQVATLDVVTMRDLVRASVAGPRFLRWLLGVMSALATALALVGIYGVMSCTVAQRQRELAVRMALGATPAVVMRQMLQRSGLLAAAGVLLGGLAALLLSRLLASLMYETSVTDPPSFLAAGLLLLLAALLACLVPALRAARTDPQAALRDPH